MEAFDPIPLISSPTLFPGTCSRVESKIEALTNSITEMTKAIHGWRKEV